MIFRWPSKTQWGNFFHILSRKERTVFFVFLFVFLISTVFVSANSYFKSTTVGPASGGKYTEGVLGSPRLINPIYAPANDNDRDLTELIFSGLMKYDGQAKIVPDLAEYYKLTDGNQVYEFYLKEKIFWHDGQPLSSNDVIFTIKTIQNPDYKSPLRANWLGVEIEKISDNGVRFKLKNPSPLFLENTTLKILPKHIWENISAMNFPLTVYNLKPVGSGPWRLKDLKQDRNGKITSLNLVKNQAYFAKTPNINDISFKFYESEEEMIRAFNQREINGLAISPKAKNIGRDANLYSPPLPRYFAVFLNGQKNKLFSEKEIRLALNQGTDKVELINKLLEGKGKTVNSPILPDLYWFAQPENNSEYDQVQAGSLLEKAGFKQSSEEGIRERATKTEPPFQFKANLRSGSQGDQVKELQKCLSRDPQIYPEAEITGVFGEKTKAAVIKFQEKYKSDILAPQGLEKGTGDVLKSTRTKLNEICFEKPEQKTQLKFTLVTSDHPQLIEAAEILKEQWKKIGAEIAIQSFDVNTLERDVIKPRNFEALLFGEVLGSFPDPFPFWHSSQKKDPGLNLALYENKEADKLLEQARQTLDSKETQKDLEKFQNILINDSPVIFLYTPDYLYLIDKKIKGINLQLLIDPSKRFSEIDKWYINTKRSWK